MVSMSRELIDATVAYVLAHPDEMTRAEADEFIRLGMAVYVAAYPLDLAGAAAGA